MPEICAACGRGWPDVIVRGVIVNPERPADFTPICRHCWNPSPETDQRDMDAQRGELRERVEERDNG
jgi:hypothetical protein